MKKFYLFLAISLICFNCLADEVKEETPPEVVDGKVKYTVTTTKTSVESFEANKVQLEYEKKRKEDMITHQEELIFKLKNDLILINQKIELLQ